ncbi:hypothetical protein GCM10010149_30940 [Nonomuraea roseoviolacea subsp. roseoviolacea]
MTGWRAEHEWLAGGASVPQQHIIRDFARSRTKAVKDIKARLPFKRRAGMPRFKRSCPLIPRRFASTATPSGRVHHDGLRAVRSENQARAAAVRAHLRLHHVRSRVPQGQELRPCDARPGWSGPGWC